MSCNGCRVLRKGCSETCILRPSLQWIETSESQGHATVFVAKFFGRAGLMSFISAVPETQRPALFQSLLFEAAGRTVNPVNGAVGLMATGNWQVCQAAVETVLRGGKLNPIPEFLGAASETDEASECTDNRFNFQDMQTRPKVHKRRRDQDEHVQVMQLADLDLSLTPNFHGKMRKSTTSPLAEKWRLGSSSMNSEESDQTTSCGDHDQTGTELQLLDLFN